MPKTGTTLLPRRGGIGGGDKGPTRAKKKEIRLPVGRLPKADAATTTVVFCRGYVQRQPQQQQRPDSFGPIKMIYEIDAGRTTGINMRSLGSALLIRKLSTKSPAATGVLKINFFPPVQCNIMILYTTERSSERWLPAVHTALAHNVLVLNVYVAGIYCTRRRDDDDGRRVLSADSPPVTVPRIPCIHIYIGRPWNAVVVVRSRGMIVKRARKPTDPRTVYVRIYALQIYTQVFRLDCFGRDWPAPAV